MSEVTVSWPEAVFLVCVVVAIGWALGKRN